MDEDEALPGAWCLGSWALSPPRHSPMAICGAASTEVLTCWLPTELRVYTKGQSLPFLWTDVPSEWVLSWVSPFLERSPPRGALPHEYLTQETPRPTTHSCPAYHSSSHLSHHYSPSFHHTQGCPCSNRAHCCSGRCVWCKRRRSLCTGEDRYVTPPSSYLVLLLVLCITPMSTVLSALPQGLHLWKIFLARLNTQES